MSYESIDSVEVRCWGKPVGALTADPNTGFYAFQYYPEFAQNGLPIAPLTMPLTTERVFVFPNLPAETFFRLPACIADSLPDTFGNALIDGWMATQGVRHEQVTPLDRLAYLGNRAMGALEFAPALQQSDPAPSALQMSELVEEARYAVKVNLHQDSPGVAKVDSSRLGSGAYPALAQLIAVGTSAGGARAKAVVGYNPITDRFVSGQLTLPKEYSPWLLKFDVGSSDKFGQGSDYGRIEYAYANMARDCGIKMTECRLYEAAGRTHFMTRRFDRTEGCTADIKAGLSENVVGAPSADKLSPDKPSTTNGKLHLQTLCALAELDFRQVATHDYSELFMVIEQLNLGYAAIDQAFARMVFNVCMANCDDHSKNHSFLMDDQGQWRLAPAYDLTHSYRSDSYWVSKHLMSVNGRFEGIGSDDLLAVARRFNVADPLAIIRNIRDVARHWPDYAKAAGVGTVPRRRIEADIEHFSQAIRRD
jgi:serine/threonine-protein kinase HipA